MKLEHIVVFLNTLSQYSVLSTFTEGIIAAFQRQGISCELVHPDRKDLMHFLAKIYVNQPDCTLSFNGLLPNEFGDFLCDKIEVPHVCCLVDSAHFFKVLASSPLNIITCPDQASQEVFYKWQFPNALFMPHAIDKKLLEEPLGLDRPYDVVFLGSAIDYLSIQEKWAARFPHKTVKALEECSQAVFENPALPYQEALENFVKKEEFEESDFENLVQEFDLFIRGKDRIELLRSIKNSQLHIFGENLGRRNFKELIKSDSKNLFFHPGVQYPEALQIMRQSKIILNSSPMFKKGGHERIFSGLALGALVLTNENRFMLENFIDLEEIVLYRSAHKGNVDELIRVYLEDEPLRNKINLAGRAKVLEKHTWDHRVNELIPKLEMVIEKLYE